MNDDLGDRLKGYEDKTKFPPNVPVIARLDGKSFHTFTKGMTKPFDENLTDLMINTTNYLARETNAVAAYTQSDEITLLFYTDKEGSEIFFNGKVQKMISVLASMCSVYFNENFIEYFPLWPGTALFDCRVFSVPDISEAANVFLWRRNDATKNSVSMLAQEHFSPKELHGKSTLDRIEMLKAIDVDYMKIESKFRAGNFVLRTTEERIFTVKELQTLPEKHAARFNPALKFKRADYIELSPAWFDYTMIYNLLNTSIEDAK